MSYKVCFVCYSTACLNELLTMIATWIRVVYSVGIHGSQLSLSRVNVLIPVYVCGGVWFLLSIRFLKAGHDRSSCVTPVMLICADLWSAFVTFVSYCDYKKEVCVVFV
jgi:hypothetical protein